MSEPNPWLSRPIAVEAPAHTATPTPLVTGPTTPQMGIQAPEHVDQLPISAQLRTADLWWLGTHGGAGETSLASLDPQWAASDHRWPLPPGSEPARVALVARSNLHGLLSAQTAAVQWAAGLVPHVDVVGLVIVADAPGRFPRQLQHLAEVISGGVARTWMVPWINEWRFTKPHERSMPPREISRLIKELHAITHKVPSAPPTERNTP